MCSVDEDDVEVLGDVWQLKWTEEDGEETDCPVTYMSFSFVHLHGVLMYLAWGLMLPLGSLLGRYYRHYWPVWFIVHIIVQVRMHNTHTLIIHVAHEQYACIYIGVWLGQQYRKHYCMCIYPIVNIV